MKNQFFITLVLIFSLSSCLNSSSKKKKSQAEPAPVVSVDPTDPDVNLDTPDSDVNLDTPDSDVVQSNFVNTDFLTIPQSVPGFNSLASNNIKDVYEHSNGDLYISTDGGLSISTDQ